MNKKSNTNSEIVEIKLQGNAAGILKQAVDFLKIFLPETLAKRLVAIILLAIGIPVMLHTDWICNKYIVLQATFLTFSAHEKVLSPTALML